MQSTAILDALKVKLKAPVRYYCQVVHIGIEDNEPFDTPIIMCLGEHSMFLLDKEMQQLQGEIFYAHMTRIVEPTEGSASSDIMRIEINDDRPRGIPAKITLISSERLTLLKHLKCYWETDYMWRLASIQNLRVDQEAIDLKKFKLKFKLKNNSNKEKYQYCSNNSLKVEQKGYGYFHSNMLKKLRLIGEFEQSDASGVQHYLRIKIQDPKQLEDLKGDLRSKTEIIAEEQLRPGENYFFKKNCPYMKKMNFAVDIATWRGWEIELKTETRYIAVIVLRRKFIPPFLDCGQDFVFITTGGEDSRKINCEPADTIFTKANSNKYYESILAQRCNALIMDEESANFYQQNLNLKPAFITYAYQYIYSIIQLILDHQKQNLVFVNTELKKIPNVEKFGEHPEKVIDAFMAESSAPDKSLGHIKWCQKVCRYLAFALDGGLYYSKLTLEEVLKSVMGGSLKDIAHLSMLKRCIKQMLHVRKITEDSNAQNEDLYPPIADMLKEYANKRLETKTWNFNERVMISLVETGYLQRELDISGDVMVYPNLLVFLLQCPWHSIELKSVICRVTVIIDDPSEMNALKPLIPHFIDVFLGKNYTLSAQAAVSLINLIYNNRENKQALYKKLPALAKKLTSKDQKVLSYTIMLLQNLASEASRRKNIATMIRDNLLGILVGKVIDRRYLSLEVVSRAITAMITISKDHTTLDYYAISQELIETGIYYIDKSDELLQKLTWFYEIMADSRDSAAIELGRIYIPIFLKKLNQNLQNDVVKNIVGLMKKLLENRTEAISLAIANNARSVMNTLYNSSSIADDVPTKRSIYSIIQLLPK